LNVWNRHRRRRLGHRFTSRSRKTAATPNLPSALPTCLENRLHLWPLENFKGHLRCSYFGSRGAWPCAPTPCAPCRKESKGALNHHPDQRDHLQPHNLARYFDGSSCASTAVGQCPASCFFFKAHSPDFSPASAVLSGHWCFQAPKGRTTSAQASGLGFRDQVIRQALQGRAKTCRNFFPDSRFIPSGGAEQWLRRSPFQGSAGKQSVNPGRWPGLG
jgi:hypothetical protein